MVMNNNKKKRTNNKKKKKSRTTTIGKTTCIVNRHADSVFMKSITCTHGSTIENFNSDYQNAIDEWVSNELKATNAEQLTIMLLEYNAKYCDTLMKDPEFIKHVFAYSTAMFLKYNNYSISGSSSSLDQSSVMKIVGYGLSLGLTVKYGSDTEKHMKYARDIHTERGIINCLYRETNNNNNTDTDTDTDTVLCNCMKPYKEKAKTMEKVGKCYGCRNEYPKAKLKRCSRCQAVQYCSNECMKEHWPKHKTYCAPCI